MTERAKCGCLECRVRAALYGGKPTAPFEINVGNAVIALGSILAELLAHCPEQSAELFVDELLLERKRYLENPLVVIQQPPMGHA